MPQVSGPTRDYRVVQVHPLLRCNLRCAHCYSESSPKRLALLPLDRLCAALDLLHEEGFNGVGISGGEPLLYSDLGHLLKHIRALGMLATVTTNAMLIDDQRAAMLRLYTDLVAVSVDGCPESHNRLRGHPRAFEHMLEGIARLKNASVPFGFIFTLTLYNLHELNWIANFAVQQGAGLLQVHPLEEIGRATEELPGAAPDALELARAFVEVARLQRTHVGRLVIQYDIADRDSLRANPDRGYAMDPSDVSGTDDLQTYRLADLIAPVIIEADGALVPLQYNFSRAYQIGDLNASNLKQQLETWKRDQIIRFFALCRSVHARLCEQDVSEYPFVNWYGEVLEASHSAAGVGSVRISSR